MNRTALCVLSAALAGCGSPGLAGTWTWDAIVKVADATGVTTQTLTTSVRLGPAAGTSLAWLTGGCEIALTEIADKATLTRETECKLTATDDIPIASRISPPLAGDTLVVSAATFELVRSQKPAQTNYTFRSGEDGLSMDFEFRIRPSTAPPGSTVGNTYSFHSTTAFAHRAR